MNEAETKDCLHGDLGLPDNAMNGHVCMHNTEVSAEDQLDLGLNGMDCSYADFVQNNNKLRGKNKYIGKYFFYLSL